MTRARLELGITPWAFPADSSAERLCVQAEHAEHLGFDSFWLPESHFAGAGSIPQPLLWHAALAVRTRRIRLGTTSYLLPIRPPLQVAEEIAVLDQLSGGRVILGVGRGFRKSLFDAYEVERSRKRDLFERSLAQILDAWSGKPVAASEDGAPPALLQPLPAQQPHPPIWVAAFGPKALAQAGRLGLPYLASPIEADTSLLANLAAHRAALAEHGHDADALEVPIMRTVFAHPDASVVSRVRDALSRQSRALRQAPSPALRRAGEADVDEIAWLGDPAYVADCVARARERLGLTHLIARTQVPGAEPSEIQRALDELAGVPRC